jgi:hypothetical protein
MIIRKHAVTKDSIANIANKYVPSFFRRLYPEGIPDRFSPEKMTIKPQDILLTKEEAYRNVVEGIVSRKNSFPENTPARAAAEAEEQFMRKNVEQGAGFVSESDYAYVPAVALDKDDLVIFKKLSPAYSGKMPQDEESWNARFFSVDIESELVHLVARRGF